MKKAILTLCGLATMTLTSCKSCECKFQGDLNNKRWELRQQRNMKLRGHAEKMRFNHEMRQKMHDRRKKQDKKG
ncbi:MAG: hypothetical protein VW270_08770 [Candidatus Poseidoniales archaeon]